MSTKSTPRDVFAHLLAIGMLYVAIVSFLVLIFQYIDLLLPSNLEYFHFSSISNTIQDATAALIIVWPVYLWLMRLLQKDELADSTKHELKIRKWLFNLTLFVAAITIIVDLIILLNGFLRGELSSRFALKSFVVLLVAAAVFSYYRWDLKRNTETKTNVPKFAASMSTAVLVVAIVAGFTIAGSPQEQRQRRLDEQRVRHLSELQSHIITYWADKETLPQDLDALIDQVTVSSLPTDPETNQAYTYTPTDELTFTLCASFATATDPRNTARYHAEENWAHEIGEQCFTRTIDPERHGNFPKPAIIR